jgi:hypothetical protein
MTDLFNSFISKSFLRSVWALEYEAFRGSEEELRLNDRLQLARGILVAACQPQALPKAPSSGAINCGRFEPEHVMPR